MATKNVLERLADLEQRIAKLEGRGKPIVVPPHEEPTPMKGMARVIFTGEHSETSASGTRVPTPGTLEAIDADMGFDRRMPHERTALSEDGTTQ